MKHRQAASGTGRTSVSDIMKSLQAKGVERKHRVTRKAPEVTVDPDAVAEIMANHTPAPVSTPLRREQLESEARKAASFDVSLLEGEGDALTEEERFRIRRRAARDKLREREEQS